MLKWALFFFIIAIIAGILGFTGIAAASVTIAKALFFIFILICIVLVALALFVGKSVLKRKGRAERCRVKTSFRPPMFHCDIVGLTTD
ncbi:MAG: DUF1328 domain-containing protein [Acidobacteria bacterium]|nr:DUF1328 domain-containing protein [Acidobacteriota bacterium]